MRTLIDARTVWLAFKRHTTLDELRADIRISENGETSGVQLRSAYWKTLLLFGTLDTSSWISTLTSTRSAYESLRARFSAAGEAGKTDESQHAESELLIEIRQDVERCMPGMSFFQDSITQNMLTNILLVFCKLNPDLGYRQGMHELVAPILWVVDQDTINLGQSSKLMGEDALLSALFNVEYIEHDVFALFSQVMANAKKFYENTTHTASENPLVARSQRITSTLLSQADPDLADHLERTGIAPQIFLIRWTRLLFGREFEFKDVLTMWDVIFAEDPTLEIVDYISLVMLLRIRWELLDSTYNEALSVLLHYPPLDHDILAQSVVIDALALRANLSISTSNRLVVKYTGRALIAINKPSTPPAIQRNITSFSGMEAFRKSLRGKPTSSDSAAIPQINFEALLQSTAQNILNKGEQLGIGKAVRNAIDDVHRRAQELRDPNTSPGANNWRQRPRSARTLSSRIRALEERNTQLAQLLDSAVAQLWDVQKVVAEAQASEKAVTTESLDLEKFSMAIGQVQYIQAYLQDSSLPLTEAEAETKPPAGDQDEASSQVNQAVAVAPPDMSVADTESEQRSVEGLLDPSDFDEALEQDSDGAVRQGDRPATETHTVTGVDKVIATSAASAAPAQSSVPAHIRPPLSESAYSWMLGQSRENSLGDSIQRPETLFSNTEPGEVVSLPKTRRGIRPRKKAAVQVVSTDVNFDFDSK